MVGFITLRGSLSGSIRLTTVGKSTRFVLKLREKPPRGGFTVYLIDGEDFASFRFSDDSDGQQPSRKSEMQCKGTVTTALNAQPICKFRDIQPKTANTFPPPLAEGRAAQNRGNRGKRGVTCAQVKKKRSLRTLPCRRTACSPQNLPLRKESSAKRKNCLREAEFPQQTAIPPRIRILPFTVPILMRISVPFAKAAPARTKARPKPRARRFFPTRIGKNAKTTAVCSAKLAFAA